MLLQLCTSSLLAGELNIRKSVSLHSLCVCGWHAAGLYPQMVHFSKNDNFLLSRFWDFPLLSIDLFCFFSLSYSSPFFSFSLSLSMFPPLTSTVTLFLSLLPSLCFSHTLSWHRGVGKLAPSCRSFLKAHIWESFYHFHPTDTEPTGSPGYRAFQGFYYFSLTKGDRR